QKKEHQSHLHERRRIERIGNDVADKDSKRDADAVDEQRAKQRGSASNHRSVLSFRYVKARRVVAPRSGYLSRIFAISNGRKGAKDFLGGFWLRGRLKQAVEADRQSYNPREDEKITVQRAENDEEETGSANECREQEIVDR